MEGVSELLRLTVNESIRIKKQTLIKASNEKVHNQYLQNHDKTLNFSINHHYELFIASRS